MTDNRFTHYSTPASSALDALKGEASGAFNKHAHTITFALNCLHNAQVEEKRSLGVKILEKVCG